jgi:hypothetical protein
LQITVKKRNRLAEKVLNFFPHWLSLKTFFRKKLTL